MIHLSPSPQGVGPGNRPPPPGAGNERYGMVHKNDFDGQLQLGVATLTETTGRESHRKVSDMIAAGYVNPHTGRLREEVSVCRACPVCDDDNPELLFAKNGFPHVRCSKCGMIYVSPMLSDKARNEMYRSDEAWTEVQANPVEKGYRVNLYRYGLGRVGPPRATKRLLDVGCGPGLFMATASAAGWQVAGVEMNSHWVAKLRLSDCDIIEAPFEEVELPKGSYECVTMWDVLEHVPCPSMFMRKARSLLAIGGRLLLLVPNADSLANRMLHEKSRSFDGAQHVNFYSAKVLEQSLRCEGFVVRSMETVFSEVGTIANHLDYQAPYTGAAERLPMLTPEMIHAFMLGSRLLALAEKVE